MSITEKEKRVLRKMFERTRAEMIAKGADKKMDPEMFKQNVAQNVLRDCMTAVFDECTPYSKNFPLGMAMRLASYALSNIPIDDQGYFLAFFLEKFRDEHVRRVASGVMLKSAWT